MSKDAKACEEAWELFCWGGMHIGATISVLPV